jgi:hypothetical protein
LLLQVNNLREIQALRRLSPHPHIIQLLEVLYDQPTGRLALVFELMVGFAWLVGCSCMMSTKTHAAAGAPILWHCLLSTACSNSAAVMSASYGWFLEQHRTMCFAPTELSQMTG